MYLDVISMVSFYSTSINWATTMCQTPFKAVMIWYKKRNQVPLLTELTFLGRRKNEFLSKKLKYNVRYYWLKTNVRQVAEDMGWKLLGGFIVKQIRSNFGQRCEWAMGDHSQRNGQAKSSWQALPSHARQQIQEYK